MKTTVHFTEAEVKSILIAHVKSTMKLSDKDEVSCKIKIGESKADGPIGSDSVYFDEAEVSVSISNTVDKGHALGSDENPMQVNRSSNEDRDNEDWIDKYNPPPLSTLQRR